MSSTEHNIYFDGAVQSLGFERDGARATVGVIEPGTFHFDTGAPERMTVISGELEAMLPGSGTWSTFPRGAVFEIPGDSAFDVRASAPSAYLCEFL